MSDFFLEVRAIRDAVLIKAEPSEDWQAAFQRSLRDAARYLGVDKIRIYTIQNIPSTAQCTEAQLDAYVERLRREGFTVTKDERNCYWIDIPHTKGEN